MEIPFLYKEKSPLAIGMSTILELAKAIEECQIGEEFIEASEANALFFEASPELVNFIKMFLFAKGAHKTSNAARVTITSATCPKKPDPGEPRVPPPAPERPTPTPTPTPSPK